MKRGPKQKRRSLWEVDNTVFYKRKDAYNHKRNLGHFHKIKFHVKRFVEMSDEEYRKFIKEN